MLEGPKLYFGPGHKVDAYNFTRQQLDPRWLGLGLARIARFSGNGNLSVSVAQHSVNLSHLVGHQMDHKRAALMHDVPELFTGDVPSPIKRLCPDLLRIDQAIIAQISHVYVIPLSAFEAIHEADRRIAEDEKLYMFGDLDQADFDQAHQKRFGITVQPWSRAEAAEAWTDRFNELFSETL